MFIFVGAQDEFGLLKPDSLGIYKYYTASDILPDSVKKFGDVWNICIQGESVYWMTRKYIFHLDKNSLELNNIIPSSSFFHTMLQSDERIFVNQPGLGLSELKNNTCVPLNGCEVIQDSRIYSIIKYDEASYLIGTRYKGFFRWNGSACVPFKTEADEWLMKNQFYHASFLSDSTFAMASLYDGITVINRKGELVLHVNKEKDGIQDNRIWHIYNDEEHNLWLATNNGISKIVWPAPFTIFPKDYGLSGNVQSITRHKGDLYVATGDGVYILEESGHGAEFRKIKGLNTQCWHLLTVNDNLLVASNLGIFKIEKVEASLKARYSTWKMLHWNKDPAILFLGLDDGIAALNIQSGNYKNLGRLPGIDIEARTLAQDLNGNIFIGTTRQGIVELRYKSDAVEDFEVIQYNEKDGLPGMNFNLVYQADKPIFTTTSGLLEFNSMTRQFEPVEKYNKFLPSSKSGAAFYTMAMDRKKRLWINDGLKPAYFTSANGALELITQPFLSLPDMLIYTIYPEEKQVWFGGPEGLICYDSEMQYAIPSSFNASISSFKSVNDSVEFGLLKQQNTTLNYENNAISVDFCSGSFVNEEATLFQTKLDGFDKDWTAWNTETNRDFTNLREGDYILRVRAKNIYNIVSNESSFPFTIRPPWYRTIWAYFIYFIFSGFVFFQAFRFRKITRYNKYLLEKQRIEKQRKITEESLRKQLAADFHDELGNKITRISLFSELIKQEGSKLPNSVKNYVDRIGDNANTLYSETRDFIWQLDPTKDSLLETIIRIKNFGDEIFTDTTVDLEFENNAKEFNSKKLSMELRKQSTRIMKEALHNVLKHSKASRVRFTVFSKNERIVFKIADNGIGLNGDTESKGNGLANMMQRSKQINAELEIKNDQGLTVELALKLPE